MAIKKICILGGSGFVGCSLANLLSDAGYEICILTRNREAQRNNLILLPGVQLVQTDIHQQANLEQYFDGCDAVINLVGILNERGRRGAGFQHAHVALVEKIAAACRHAGIRRVLQMSALNADPVNGASHYLKTKGQAEELLFNNPDLHVTCYRPSVIFGPRDSFFRRFAGLLQWTPLVFPLACHDTRFAPVYVLDVARAMLTTLQEPGSYDRSYSLCGPKIYTLAELVEFTRAHLGVKRRIIPLNDFLSRLQAAVFDFVPGKPFSTDNYLSAKKDSICERNDFAELGIQPRSIESIVPGYLAHSGDQRFRYMQLRARARR